MQFVVVVSPTELKLISIAKHVDHAEVRSLLILRETDLRLVTANYVKDMQ